MNKQQIALVKSSFAEIGHRCPDFASHFYTRLFEIDPTLRPMFPGNIKAQGDKLTMMLSTIVSGLDRLHGYLPAIEALAVRHISYGVTVRHYLIVGTALIDTIAATLKSDFDADTRSAWLDAYGLLSNAMIAAAQAVAVKPAAMRQVA